MSCSQTLKERSRSVPTTIPKILMSHMPRRFSQPSRVNKHAARSHSFAPQVLRETVVCDICSRPINGIRPFHACQDCNLYCHTDCAHHAHHVRPCLSAVRPEGSGFLPKATMQDSLQPFLIDLFVKQLKKEDREYYRMTPVQFIFAQNPQRWGPVRVLLWLFSVRLDLHWSQFWSRQISGSKLLRMNRKSLAKIQITDPEYVSLFLRQRASLTITLDILPAEMIETIMQFIPYGQSWFNLTVTGWRGYNLTKEYFDVRRWHPFPTSTLALSSPLNHAAQNGLVAMTAELLKCQNLPVQHTQLETPIEAAARTGQVGILRMLLEDDRLDPSANKNYAMRIAKKYRHYEVMNLLNKHPRVMATQDTPYSPLPKKARQEIAYFGSTIDRQQAENLLRGEKPGTYLIRWSHNVKSFVITTVDTKQQFIHIGDVWPSKRKEGSVEVMTDIGLKEWFPSISQFLKTQTKVNEDLVKPLAGGKRNAFSPFTSPFHPIKKERER